jgi:catechol 2,3-dioxygenase-like lactoylglutathione lyase family enzyme
MRHIDNAWKKDHKFGVLRIGGVSEFHLQLNRQVQDQEGYMDRIGCTALAHVHVMVDDLDHASAFYRDVLDFVEMQSHHDLVNRGLAAYYGVEDPENFVVSLRFLTWPGALTLKLIQVKRWQESASRSQYGGVSTYGQLQQGNNATLSVEVADLDETYKHLVRYSRDYGAEYKVQLLSPPVALSPLLPHQVGATRTSVLYGHHEILEELGRSFPERRKFQLVDPFGLRWEFNNATA